MSFLAALRAPARRAAFANAPRASVRTSTRTAFRKYSTAPEGKSSNTLLYATLGGVVLAGAGYYVYSSSSDAAKEAGTAVKGAAQAVKVATNFVPTKEDYQKVDFLIYFPLLYLTQDRFTMILQLSLRRITTTMVGISDV